MKRILLFTLIFLPIVSFAQDKIEKTLSIIGTSRITVTPDIGILNIHLSQLDTNFNKAITRLGDKTNYYIKILVSLGFKEEEIKTTSFSVSKNRIYRREESVDSGYIASQNVKVEFANDKKILSKILNKFSSSQSDVDFSFNFKLSEKLKQDVQNKVIELAIKDAKTKAELVSKSSGIKLKELRHIDYGYNHMSGMQQIETEYEYLACGAPSETRTFNFTPEDLVFHDSVSIDWIIE